MNCKGLVAGDLSLMMEKARERFRKRYVSLFFLRIVYILFFCVIVNSVAMILSAILAESGIAPVSDFVHNLISASFLFFVLLAGITVISDCKIGLILLPKKQRRFMETCIAADSIEDNIVSHSNKFTKVAIQELSDAYDARRVFELLLTSKEILEVKESPDTGVTFIDANGRRCVMKLRGIKSLYARTGSGDHLELRIDEEGNYEIIMLHDETVKEDVLDEDGKC